MATDVINSDQVKEVIDKRVNELKSNKNYPNKVLDTRIHECAVLQSKLIDKTKEAK